MQPKYRHLFFDLDHTLWDFEQNSEQSWRQIFTEHQLGERLQAPFEDFIQSYRRHNDAMWSRYRNGLVRKEEMRWKRVWLTMADFRVADEPMARILGASYLDLLPTRKLLMPHAKELLEHCQGRYALHLITNGFEETQWQKLRNSGIDGYFSEVITSEKSNSMKPLPGIFEYALQLTGASSKECLMIGDALDIDVLGAANAGWDQVYYNPMRIRHGSRPTYEVAHLQELEVLL